MDTLKTISFPIAGLVLGMLAVFLGLGMTLPISDKLVITLPGAMAKFVALPLGFSLIAASIYIEWVMRYSRNSAIQVENSPPAAAMPGNPQLTAVDQLPLRENLVLSGPKSVFHMLDEASEDRFPEMIKGATRLSILARTCVNLLNNYHDLLVAAGRSGCEIRILFVDPRSPAVDFLYGADPSVVKKNMEAATAKIRSVRKSLKKRFKAKVINHAPTMSLVHVERRNDTESFINLQLYFLHSRIGRDRPTCRIARTDQWYPAFQDEFTKLWEKASDWNYEEKIPIAVLEAKPQ